MSAADAPWRLSIAELVPLIRDGALSPVDLLDAYLERIGALDGALHSFVHLNAHARAAAEAAQAEIAAGRWRGPLHGVPIGVKDNHLTADMPTTAGAPGEAFPLRDATAVARLRAAGAVLIGKTRMHQFAWGMETPPTANPRDLSRVPGGSSGGSGAAVAAGLCAAALGSDTGGSIRIPASLCGCVGLKPTFGLIGRGGIVPHSWSLDHAGPLAASVADAALLTEAMAGPDPDDPGCAGLAAPGLAAAAAPGASVAGLRVGVCHRHFFEGLTPAVERAADAALAALVAAGARIVEFDAPELSVGLGAIFAIELASSTAWHDRRLREGRVAGFEPDVRLLVEMGRLVSGADYLQAERYRRRLGEVFAARFADVDVVAGPTLPLTAWRMGERSVDIGGRSESVLAVSWRLTYPWNLLGLPALSLPCGVDGDGLPIGFQIAGPAFGEAAVLRAGAALEAALGGPMARG
ncbi:amidase [Rubrimonas cliftonensis]|uniref:Aspartyl/glutamyl-tRNA(Asn/Gln) amidotransferase subunit A n=1 Tax=Rubrimonas cliftonensis TaxID=89524 RepID=A0A1H4D9Y3_9RHOB|nr:amidase [Rubrimonas cliftonensis]SEA69260.1 aspartyl/glutamyl-tRNA(Asn/Gln) amidotransferase subunit A [Rubrimonas cliftonensis]